MYDVQKRSLLAHSVWLGDGKAALFAFPMEKEGGQFGEFVQVLCTKLRVDSCPTEAGCSYPSTEILSERKCSGVVPPGARFQKF